jgi:hypothetical protein
LLARKDQHLTATYDNGPLLVVVIDYGEPSDPEFINDFGVVAAIPFRHPLRLIAMCV